jgi:hypothetical protein
MNTQQQMMQILQATNPFYTSPIKNGWQLSKTSDCVYGEHNVTGISYFFTLDPETKIIKAESWSLSHETKHTITIYTGTINLAGHLIAPDMILALHTLFNYNVASDASYVVENNRAKLMPPAKAKKKLSIASDDSLARQKLQASTKHKSYSLWDDAISAVPVRSTFSKFVRYLVYPSSIFKRKS